MGRLEQDLWKCPVNTKNKCSTKKLHRVCPKCRDRGNPHCWDCCKSCHDHECKNVVLPPPDYDLPEGTEW